MKVVKFAAAQNSGGEELPCERQEVGVDNRLSRIAAGACPELLEAEKEALMLELQRQTNAVFAARTRTIADSLAMPAPGRPRLSLIKGGKED